MRRLRVRVRLRRRRTLTAAREARILLAQAARLAPFRERLLRRVTPARRRWTLDLACGPGTLTRDLASRVAGPLVSLDADPRAVERARKLSPGGSFVVADGAALPFRDASFELVVTQACWMWFEDADGVARECRRVLAPGGALVACGEPDFGGAIEEPAGAALAPVWTAALARAGADPHAGRRLAPRLRGAGFARVDAEVFGRVADDAGSASLRDHDPASLRDHDPASLRDHDTASLRDHDTASLRDHDTASLRDHDTASLRDDELASLRALALSPEERSRVDAAPPPALLFVPWFGAIAWR